MKKFLLLALFGE